MVFLQPGFPGDMPLFVRGLAAVGARVVGVGDTSVDQLPDVAREVLTHYIRVDWANHDAALQTIMTGLRGRHVDLVETLWEPTVLLAARLREAIGVPGTSVAQAVAFRDKERMKELVATAGLRVPHSARCTTRAQCHEAAERIGYPLIVKPIDGAGSLDTYRVIDSRDLDTAVDRLGHIAEVSVEEFVDGEEFTYDTICAAGEVCWETICEYRPRPLVGKQVEWISQQCIAHRDVDAPGLVGGRRLGQAVIAAFGLHSGFTHMEWYRTWDGEVVFGEIGGRSPGGGLVHLANWVADADLFTGWAEAVCHGRLSANWERMYNVGQVIKRAQGSGNISHIDGLGRLYEQFGAHIVNVDLLAVGQPRRDWHQVVVSDGVVVVRHPDLDAVYSMCDQIGTDLQLYAG